jgi:hypothetical protein
MNHKMKILWVMLTTIAIILIGAIKIAWALFYGGCSIVDRKFDNFFNWITK